MVMWMLIYLLHVLMILNLQTPGLHLVQVSLRKNLIFDMDAL